MLTTSTVPASLMQAEVERVCASILPLDKFTKVENVCIFAEHETHNRQGELQQYTADVVEKIAENCNARIVRSNSLCPIVDGHTPDPEEIKHGIKQPEVKGYYGTHRVGKLPDGRTGIFADEYRLKQEEEYFTRHPGRSVEIWMHPDIENRFFAPVAALGAETPRLELPMKFSRSFEGAEVAKYSAVMAGATNSFVPKNVEKERYDCMMSPEEIQQLALALAPAVAQAITATAMATPPAPAPVAPAAAVPPAAPSPLDPTGATDPMAVDEPTDSDLPIDDLDGDGDSDLDIDDEGDSPVSNTEAPKKEDDKEKLSLRRQLKEKELEVARYKRIAEDVDALKADKIYAERYAKLSEMQSEGYQFRPGSKEVAGKQVQVPGIVREMERCRGMSDEQFADHLVVIAENYSKVPLVENGVALYVPSAEHYQAVTNEHQARADAALEARQRVEKYRAEGKKADYPTVLAEVHKEKGIKIA